MFQTTNQIILYTNDIYEHLRYTIYIYLFYRQPLGQVAVVLPRLPPPVRSN